MFNTTGATIFDSARITINNVNLDTVQTPYNVQLPAYASLRIKFNNTLFSLISNDTNSLFNITQIENNIVKGNFNGFLFPYPYIPVESDTTIIENGSFCIEFPSLK